MKRRPLSVLGVHPSSYGFGWAFFDGPGAPPYWATADVRGDDKNLRALARFEKILCQYKPKIVALEMFDGEGVRRHDRIRELYRTVVKMAADKGAIIRIFTRAQIAKTLATDNAGTREEIAAAVAGRLPELRLKLPPKRKVWASEHPNLALFSAVACALTCYASLAQDS